MELWSRLLPKIIAGIMSIIDASNLRSRLYEIKDEHELMWTALDDIARMHKDHESGKYARRILDKIPVKYGR